MNKIVSAMNAAARRIDAIFPGYFPTAKHNHYDDFGWPADINFDMLHQMFRRNGLAASAVNKTILRTWEAMPEFWEQEEPTESRLEADFRKRMEDIFGWRALIETDKRSAVGGYAGAILRLGDSKQFRDPVDRVPGGLDGLVEIVPAWRGQLRVSQWDTDPQSQDYGKPTMFTFHEAAVQEASHVENMQYRQFDVHPDRVIIWSADGTVFAPSMLEPGYNDLIDAEKIKGAGGEGFWKTAKASPVLEVDPETQLSDMAQAMGVSLDDLREKMSEQVSDYQSGFDNMLMLQGMKANNASISLPIPEHFFGITAQSFAASVNMPVRALIGNQTGERASTEDQREFSKSCMARRERIAIPALRLLLGRLERFGMIPERDWTVHWASLLDETPQERMDRSKSMAEINKSTTDPMIGGEPVFTVDEIRDQAGYPPLDLLDGDGDGEEG